MDNIPSLWALPHHHDLHLSTPLVLPTGPAPYLGLIFRCQAQAAASASINSSLLWKHGERRTELYVGLGHCWQKTCTVWGNAKKRFDIEDVNVYFNTHFFHFVVQTGFMDKLLIYYQPEGATHVFYFEGFSLEIKSLGHFHFPAQSAE